MKTITLLATSILLIGSAANASEVRTASEMERRAGYSFDEPISFIERGIEFFVFSNGDFDFNTRPQDSQGSTYFYKTAGKRASAASVRRPVNYGVLIEHDSFGRVRRVGNTFINYDGNDRVSRIGTVYLKYNRFGLTQIGGMRITYNSRGQIVNMYGNIKGVTRNQGFAYTYYGSTNDYYNDYASNYSDDNSYYYYRTDGTKAKIEDKK
jgi:hypothetical protein